MPEFSRSEIQRFTVTHANGAHVKFSDKIKVGDEYTVEIPEMQSEIAKSLNRDVKSIDNTIQRIKGKLK